MGKLLLNNLGNILGCIGIVVFLLSGFTRLFGDVTSLHFKAINVMIVGIGFMTMGIFSKFCGR